MEPWQWGVLFKPLLFFAVSAAILYPARRAVMRWLPEGRVKRLLLFRIRSE